MIGKRLFARWGAGCWVSTGPVLAAALVLGCGENEPAGSAMTPLGTGTGTASGAPSLPAGTGTSPTGTTSAPPALTNTAAPPTLTTPTASSVVPQPSASSTAIVPTGPVETGAPPTATAPEATSAPTAAPTDVPSVTPTSTATAPTGSGTGDPPTTELPHGGDHCLYGFDPHPTDATMADGYAEHENSGQVDTTVQPEVIAWMEENKWQSAHYQWHAVRRCGGGGGPGGGFFGGAMPGSEENTGIDICTLAEVPADQECENGADGYWFMVMHRHMITSLKSLWPNHTEQFEGWDTFPTSMDVIPEAWQDVPLDWSQTILTNADKADNIADHLDEFATEGDFAQWMQCTGSQLHGELHFQWVRMSNQDHGLGNQFRNIDNYMFWKMHGWMDKVWEKYRVAKGMSPDDQKLKDDIINQCREMDALALIVDPSLEQGGSNEPLPEESGVFHEQVRPIFESEANKCVGCHGAQAPSGSMSLGGNISSADIVAGLINQVAEGTDMYPLVVPGDPENSWLYLKAKGETEGVTCSGTQLCTQTMPPPGVTMTADELQILYDWIQSGAPAPTSP